MLFTKGKMEANKQKDWKDVSKSGVISVNNLAKGNIL